MDGNRRGAIDLTELAKGLPPGKIGDSLRQAVNDCKASATRVMDLEEAKACLDVSNSALATMIARGQPDENGARAQRTCFFTAVTLYARATKNEKCKQNRKYLEFRTKLDPSLVVDHDYFITLRDDAFAHWGPGKTDTGDPWLDFRLVAILETNKLPAIDHAYKWTNSITAISDKLMTLIDKSLEIANDIANDNFNRAGLAFAKFLLATPGEDLSALKNFKFDSRAYYGSQASSEAFLTGSNRINEHKFLSLTGSIFQAGAPPAVGGAPVQDPADPA